LLVTAQAPVAEQLSLNPKRRR